MIPPLSLEQLVNFIYAVYYYIRDLIKYVLETTIFRGYPEYATTYGDAFTLLISLTTLYVILELFTAAKKVVKIVLILGWILLFAAMALSKLVAS